MMVYIDVLERVPVNPAAVPGLSLRPRSAKGTQGYGPPRSDEQLATGPTLNPCRFGILCGHDACIRIVQG